MATRKNAAPSVVKFSVGEVELAAANALREAGEKEVSAFKAFHDTVIVPHDVPLAALLPRKNGEKRSNVETAAYDFTVALYWVVKFGQDIAARMLDANVKGDTVMPVSAFISGNGRPYADQTKSQLKQSFGPGSSYWVKFVQRLQAIAATGADVQRKAGTRAGDAEYIAARVNDIVARLKKLDKAENCDGSVDPVTAARFAAALLDTCKNYGVDCAGFVKAK